MKILIISLLVAIAIILIINGCAVHIRLGNKKGNELNTREVNNE